MLQSKEGEEEEEEREEEEEEEEVEGGVAELPQQQKPGAAVSSAAPASCGAHTWPMRICGNGASDKSRAPLDHWARHAAPGMHTRKRRTCQAPCSAWHQVKRLQTKSNIRYMHCPPDRNSNV